MCTDTQNQLQKIRGSRSDDPQQINSSIFIRSHNTDANLGNTITNPVPDPDLTSIPVYCDVLQQINSSISIFSYNIDVNLVNTITNPDPDPDPDLSSIPMYCVIASRETCKEM